MTKVKYSPAAAPHAWWDDLYQLDRQPVGFDRVQVLETEHDPRPTGLLDAQGRPLYRIVEKQPIGFRPLREV